MRKRPVENRNAPQLASFSWGLRISDVQEWVFLTGRGDVGPDRRVRHPNDPIAQARAILKELEEVLTNEGYGIDAIVRMDLTVTKDVDAATLEEILGLWANFISPSHLKPAAGTIRVVHGLGRDGMLVEFEFLVAK